MTPEEEFERGQAEGRARLRKKAFLRTSAYGLGMATFFGIFIPLMVFEVQIIDFVPFLAAFGRLGILLFAAIAAVPARFVWSIAGGKALRDIEAWERRRDDL
jgi:hypothetical protein